MARLLWLPAVLRAAGLTVHEVSGWKTRGADSFGPVRGITCHHTAGSRTSTDEDEIRVLLNGSTTAPPPIAQLYLSRTGDWWVVASGLCYHNLVGWGGPNKGYGNDSLLGIEAQHSGGSEPWTDVQYRSYVRGVAALVKHRATGYAVTVARVAGHKEHQPGAKTDPSFDMDRFRAAVTAEMEDDMPLTDADVAKVAAAAAKAVWDHKHPHPTRTGELQSKGVVMQYMDAVHDAQSGKVIAALQHLGVELGEVEVDEQAIVTGILAGLTPELAKAIPPDVADKVVTILLDRIAAAAQA